MKRAQVSGFAGHRFDLIVIGGGITGAAIARDAALRGLDVIVIEKEDFASGTSSRSSKLIHGGLRYLETFQLGLVAESVRERELALRLAPHLTRVQPFLYLLYNNSPEKRWLLNLGLSFYDLASGSWRKRCHRMLGAAQVLALQPQFRREGLRGAALFYDAATDDARLTIDTLKSAATHGAVMVNHCEVIGLVLDDRRCTGVRVIERSNGQEHRIKAHYVINATGPWSEQILRFEDNRAQILQPSKGVHIALRKSDFPLHSGVFMRSPDDGRIVWPIPSLEDDRVYVGTTDSTFDGDLDAVHPDGSDLQYLLNAANHLMPTARLTRQHIVGTWAGVRPLIASKKADGHGNTPRTHQILVSASGLFSVLGGKLTSHRIMARQVLDAVIRQDRQSHKLAHAGPYRADKVPLEGASAPGTQDAGSLAYSAEAIIQALCSRAIPAELARIWVRRYGHHAHRIAKLWHEDAQGRRKLGARQLTVAELRYCVHEEATYTIADLLMRRTCAFFWDPGGGLDAVAAIAAEMQTLLGWSDQETRAQIDHYRTLVNHHRPQPTGTLSER